MMGIPEFRYYIRRNMGSTPDVRMAIFMRSVF